MMVKNANEYMKYIFGLQRKIWSSIARALHQYRRGHGFEFHLGLNLFFCNIMKCNFNYQQAGLRQLFQEKQNISIPELPGKRKSFWGLTIKNWKISSPCQIKRFKNTSLTYIISHVKFHFWKICTYQRWARNPFQILEGNRMWILALDSLTSDSMHTQDFWSEDVGKIYCQTSSCDNTGTCMWPLIY